MAMAYQRQNLSQDSKPGDILMVVHDFKARSPDELTLRRGERIALVELDDGFGDGWYLGKHLRSGVTGLFPGVYTTKLPPTLPTLRMNGSVVRASLPAHSFAHSPLSFVQPGLDARPMSFNATRDPPPVPNSAVDADPSPEPLAPLAQTSSSPPENARFLPFAVASASSIPSIQRSINETIGSSKNGQDSPVMNETLSVIQEHMDDLSTPRHSLMVPDQTVTNDSESEYSSHLDSHIPASETDESINKLSEREVRQWNPKQTADHLRKVGIESKHCDIFEEQEITGDVILEMDQQFIYMKEFDFGLMGRRLKTWHKIRDFQEEVKGAGHRRQGSIGTPGPAASNEDLGNTYSRLDGLSDSFLPYIPSFADQPGSFSRHARQNTNPDHIVTPLQPSGANLSRSTINKAPESASRRAPIRPDSPGRPSAASIREMNHSRRHSSMDAGPISTFEPPGSAMSEHSIAHKKQSSLDRGWSMNATTPNPAGLQADASHRLSMTTQEENRSSDVLSFAEPTPIDLDRGYFSGGELDSRRNRNLLRKRDSAASPSHSRLSSVADDSQRASAAALKRHSKLGSADSIRDLVPSVTSPASKAYHSNTFKGRLRSASAKTPQRSISGGGISPTVTNLEADPIPNFLLQSPTAMDKSNLSTAEPMNGKMPISSKARRVLGLRAISDALTGSEKSFVTSPATIPSPIKESDLHSPARTGSTTPSITSKSIEIDNTDTSSRGTDGAAMSLLQTRPSQRPRAKSKKETSAYARGLMKITPADQRVGCDYSGWMKKKSSSLVATWKPRLFILRGRRLSYYYAETDTEERGVIDISLHKVLVANNDPITTLHAQLTGAASPSNPYSITSAPDPAASLKDSSTTPFYFKLLPPRAGSRAVSFTKPTVHYFQVDSLAEGRRWMGAMMKATIEHTYADFETTNKQKVISLRTARERRERPPALKDIGQYGEGRGAVEKEKETMDEEGLGLQFEEDKENKSNGVQETKAPSDVAKDGLDTGQLAE